MAEILAVFPLSAMSKISASPSGQMRTRSPRRYSTPATRIRSMGGDSSQGLSGVIRHAPIADSRSQIENENPVLMMNGAILLSIRRSPSDRLEAPDRPVESHELLAGEGLGALEQRPGAVVDGAHRPFLVLGQGEDPEREDLV